MILNMKNNFIKMQLMSIWNAWMMILNIKIYFIYAIFSIWNTWIMILNIK